LSKEKNDEDEEAAQILLLRREQAWPLSSELGATFFN
jgi:hypothetical protein